MLATQAELERHLQTVFDNQPEPVAAQLLEDASDIVEQYVGRRFESQVGDTEVLDSDGSTTLRLGRLPVTAVSALTENDVALTEGTDFLWYPDGRLVRIAGSKLATDYWRAGPQMVSVTFDHGTAAIPAAIRRVVLNVAGRAFQAAQAFANAPTEAGYVESITLQGSDSVKYKSQLGAAVNDVSAVAVMLTRDDEKTLDRFRLVGIA